MNRDQRQTNNVFHEISKRKANPNEYDGAIIYNTTRDHFKMRAHSLVCTTPNHRLDRLCPPPLDHVSSLQPLIPIMTSAVSTSTIEFHNTQSSAPISQPCRYPMVPIMANGMNSSTTKLLNNQPPDLPSQSLMPSSLTHFNGLQPNDSPISQPYRYPTVHIITNTVNNSPSPYPPSQSFLPSSLTHFSGHRPNNARTSLPYRYPMVPIMTVNNSTAEPSQSSLHLSLDHFSSHQPNKLNDFPIMTNALNTPTSEVFNTQPLYPPSQPSLTHVTNDQPIVWHDVPITNRTKTMNTTTAELQNIQLSPPPSQSLPSLPSPLTPPSPSPLPPPSHQEQELLEASVADFMQQFENKMKKDDSNHELLYGNWSPFHPMIATSDEYQQQENISPQVPVTLPSCSPTRPNSLNDLGLENIQQLIPTIPNDIESENIQPPVPMTSLSRSLAEPNSPINLGSENISLSVSAFSPSQYWHWPDSPNSPLSPSLLLSPIRPPENVTSPVPVTSPPRSIPNSPNEPSSPTMMLYPTLVSSPTTGLFTNMD